MNPHNLPMQYNMAPWEIPDPGDGGAIPITQSGVVNLVSGAGNETRTLANPIAVGQRILLNFDTDGGGNIVVTVAGYVNAEEDNTLTFSDAGEQIELVAVKRGGVLRWCVPNQDVAGTGTNCPTLSKV